MTTPLRTSEHPSPLLARLGAGRGLVRDVLGGVALLTATLVLWGWFALAVLPPSDARLTSPAAGQAAPRAIDARAGRASPPGRAS